MENKYLVRFKPSESWPNERIRALWSKEQGIRVHFDSDTGIGISSPHESVIRRIYAEAKEGGSTCSFEAGTVYDRADALIGELGEVILDVPRWGAFQATLPQDAFDLSKACPNCGLGGQWVKPHILTPRSIKNPNNFAYGQQGTQYLLMRSHIGREIIAATGQPGCMRHPTTRSGTVIEEWMEAVPLATLPPLSPASQGVFIGRSRALCRTGETPQVVPPCPGCGRRVWGESGEVPPRLVYPRDAAAAAQRHGVVLMYEPRDVMPQFDSATRAFKSYYGFPVLLFTRPAIEAFLKYSQTEHLGGARVRPVFAD